MPRLVWLVSLLAAAVSVTLSLTVFAHGSPNNDEGVYLLQAEALRHGRLTVAPVEGQVEAAQPWLFAVRDGEYAGKYLPVVPALYALGLLVTGSVVPVLAAFAALLPLLVWRLARRCGLSPGRATVAAAVVAMSPLALVQSALVLSYLPFLLLVLLAWDLALAHAAGARGRAAPLGLVATAATCARPFDALVLLGPVLVWAYLRGDRRAVVPFAIGAAPLAVAVLLYNAAVTGSPLRLPFGLLEARDSLGFGDRKLYPEDDVHPFGPGESVRGLVEHFLVGATAWTLLPVAVVALVLRRPVGAARVVCLATAALPVAYLVFWGPYNASVVWGGTDVVGVFYALPLLPAIGLLVATADRRAVVIAVAGVAALTNAGQATAAAVRAREVGARTGEIVRLADGARERGVLLLDVDPPYLGHPLTALRNAPGQRAHPVLVSSVLEPTSLPELTGASILHLSPDGTAYSLRRLAPVVTGEITVRHDTTVEETLVVERAGRRWACRVTGPVRLRLTASGVEGCGGATVPDGLLAYRGCTSPECVSLTFHRGNVTAWRRVVLVPRGDAWLVPADGDVVAQRGRGWVDVVP